MYQVGSYKVGGGCISQRKTTVISQEEIEKRKQNLEALERRTQERLKQKEEEARQLAWSESKWALVGVLPEVGEIIEGPGIFQFDKSTGREVCKGKVIVDSPGYPEPYAFRLASGGNIGITCFLKWDEAKKYQRGLLQVNRVRVTRWSESKKSVHVEEA